MIDRGLGCLQGDHYRCTLIAPLCHVKFSREVVVSAFLIKLVVCRVGVIIVRCNPIEIRNFKERIMLLSKQTILVCFFDIGKESRITYIF